MYQQNLFTSKRTLWFDFTVQRVSSCKMAERLVHQRLTLKAGDRYFVSYLKIKYVHMRSLWIIMIKLTLFINPY